MHITGKTKLIGVWGCPVSHSRSPQMQNAALAVLGLDWAYVPMEVQPKNIVAAAAGIRALNFVGVNVTVPLKELVVPHLDSVSETARRLGSVNTIHNSNGVLHGDSTDDAGFVGALADCGQSVEGRHVYLLGAGGTARAVAFAIAERGGRVSIANRTAEKANALAARVNEFFPHSASVTGWGMPCALECDLIVNTTSLGMTPHLETIPMLPPGWPLPAQFVYDVIYAPPETQFLALARSVGCPVSNGLGMLAHQGAVSLALWTGLPLTAIPLGIMMDALRV